MRLIIAVAIVITQLCCSCIAFGQGVPEPGISIGDLPPPDQRNELPLFGELAPSDSQDSKTLVMENQMGQMRRLHDAQSFGYEASHSSSDCMANYSESCCEQRDWYAGAAVVFAKPHFKESFQISTLNLATGTQSLIPFSYDYSPTPRVWFGVRSGQTGLRVSYWDFDQEGDSSNRAADASNIYGAHVVSTIFPANIFALQPGQSLIANDSLETRIINVYGTIDGCSQGINFTGAVGLRYAKLVQSYDAVVASNNIVLNQPSFIISQLRWDREFSGVGPSLAFDARKRLGGSSISAVVNGGGALMFGEKSLNRSVFNDQSPQPSPPFLNLEKADEVVGMGELGFGLEWSGRTGRGNELRFRGMYEGQLWAEAGAPTLGFLGFQGFALQAELRR